MIPDVRDYAGCGGRAYVGTSRSLSPQPLPRKSPLTRHPQVGKGAGAETSHFALLTPMAQRPTMSSQLPSRCGALSPTLRDVTATCGVADGILNQVELDFEAQVDMAKRMLEPPGVRVKKIVPGVFAYPVVLRLTRRNHSSTVGLTWMTNDDIGFDLTTLAAVRRGGRIGKFSTAGDGLCDGVNTAPCSAVPSRCPPRDDSKTLMLAWGPGGPLLHIETSSKQERDTLADCLEHISDELVRGTQDPDVHWPTPKNAPEVGINAKSCSQRQLRPTRAALQRRNTLGVRTPSVSAVGSQISTEGNRSRGSVYDQHTVLCGLDRSTDEVMVATCRVGVMKLQKLLKNSAKRQRRRIWTVWCSAVERMNNARMAADRCKWRLHAVANARTSLLAWHQSVFCDEVYRITGPFWYREASLPAYDEDFRLPEKAFMTETEKLVVENCVTSSGTSRSSLSAFWFTVQSILSTNEIELCLKLIIRSVPVPRRAPKSWDGRERPSCPRPLRLAFVGGDLLLTWKCKPDKNGNDIGVVDLKKITSIDVRPAGHHGRRLGVATKETDRRVVKDKENESPPEIAGHRDESKLGSILMVRLQDKSTVELFFRLEEEAATWQSMLTKLALKEQGYDLQGLIDINAGLATDTAAKALARRCLEVEADMRSSRDSDGRAEQGRSFIVAPLDVLMAQPKPGTKSTVASFPQRHEQNQNAERNVQSPHHSETPSFRLIAIGDS